MQRRKLTFKFSISLTNVNTSFVPHTFMASASFNFSSNLDETKFKFIFGSNFFFFFMNNQQRKKFADQGKNVSHLTVAATWKTIFTFFTNNILSLGEMPRPGKMQSPWIGMILWRNLGISFRTWSKS